MRRSEAYAELGRDIGNRLEKIGESIAISITKSEQIRKSIVRCFIGTTITANGHFAPYSLPPHIMIGVHILP